MLTWAPQITRLILSLTLAALLAACLSLPEASLPRFLSCLPPTGSLYSCWAPLRSLFTTLRGLPGLRPPESPNVCTPACLSSVAPQASGSLAHGSQLPHYLPVGFRPVALFLLEKNK